MLAVMSLLTAMLLIKNPQEAEWDQKETLDILRVHFLWAQPEIFVVCEI